jgi:hypothetical protein
LPSSLIVATRTITRKSAKVAPDAGVGASLEGARLVSGGRAGDAQLGTNPNLGVLKKC